MNTIERSTIPSDGLAEVSQDVLYLWNRLTRIVKEKPINLGDIVSWVAEAELEYLANIDDLAGYADIPFTVSKNQVLLPCNIFRILNVLYAPADYRTTIKHNVMGHRMIIDKNAGHEVIYISFFGLALDDNGYPIIQKHHFPALEALCIKNLYYEDYLNNKIDANRWFTIEQDWVNKCRAVSGSLQNVTMDDMNKLNWISYNLIPRVGVMRASSLMLSNVIER